MDESIESLLLRMTEMTDTSEPQPPTPMEAVAQAYRDEIAALRAQVQEAKEIMEEIQWSRDPNDEYGRWCMACGASTGLGSKRKPKKHHEGCRLAKFLKETAREGGGV